MQFIRQLTGTRGFSLCAFGAGLLLGTLLMHLL